MEENTVKLINELATKLGTTSEYLWSILIGQARISAITHLIMTIFIFIGAYLFYKVHIRLSEIPKTDDKYANSKYDENDAYAPIMIFSCVLIFALLLCCLFNIPDIINGLFNPKYWALREVLDVIK